MPTQVEVTARGSATGRDNRLRARKGGSADAGGAGRGGVLDGVSVVDRGKKRRFRLVLPWAQYDPQDGRMVLRVPRRTYYTLVFGTALAALARMLLACFTDQRPVEMALAYTAAAVMGFALSKGVAPRMQDERMPRLYTWSMSTATLVLYAVPGATAAMKPTVESTRMAAATVVVLGLMTGIGELLHRISAVDTIPEKTEAVRRGAAQAT